MEHANWVVWALLSEEYCFAFNWGKKVDFVKSKGFDEELIKIVLHEFVTFSVYSVDQLYAVIRLSCFILPVCVGPPFQQIFFCARFVSHARRSGSKDKQ